MAEIGGDGPVVGAAETAVSNTWEIGFDATGIAESPDFRSATVRARWKGKNNDRRWWRHRSSNEAHVQIRT